MKVMGIDNGFSGGLVTINDVLGTREISKIVMPVIETKKGKHELDMRGLINYFLRECPDVIFLEKAQAMPKQGVTGVFHYAEGYGIIKGIVNALGFRLELVPPQTWQKEMFRGKVKNGTKELSYAVCRELFPCESWLATERSRKFHTGLVDACCLAMYGLRFIWEENSK
jgi:crossover junction endodeoxyribonuclease RuvC